MEIERTLEECSEKSSVSQMLFVGALEFLSKSYLSLSVLSSNPNPLLSIFITFYCLILLYFPHLFLSFVFSPVFISTAVLLATLLRLGTAQQEKHESHSPETEKPDSKCKAPCVSELRTHLDLARKGMDPTFSPEADQGDPEDEAVSWVESEKGAVTEMGFVRKADFSETFVEWDLSGPLDVIYEEYEGEEDDDWPEKTTEVERRDSSVDGFLLSSFCYPDSDSSEGESPGWDSPENLCFRWEESEGLIEIPLRLKPTVGYEADEENLIEISL